MIKSLTNYIMYEFVQRSVFVWHKMCFLFKSPLEKFFLLSKRINQNRICWILRDNVLNWEKCNLETSKYFPLKGAGEITAANPTKNIKKPAYNLNPLLRFDNIPLWGTLSSTKFFFSHTEPTLEVIF